MTMMLCLELWEEDESSWIRVLDLGIVGLDRPQMQHGCGQEVGEALVGFSGL